MTRRHLVYAAIGLLLLLGNLYAFWPFVEAGREMDAFCNRLPVGATVDQVRTRAAAQGYEVTTEPGGRVVVEDPRSMGRRTCALQFGIPPAAASGAASS